MSVREGFRAQIAGGAVVTTWAATPAGADAAVKRIASCLARDVAATQRGRNRGLLAARLELRVDGEEGAGDEQSGASAVTVLAVDASASRSRAAFERAVALRMAEADVAVSPGALLLLAGAAPGACGPEPEPAAVALGWEFLRAAAATARAARGRAALLVAEGDAAGDGANAALPADAGVTTVGRAEECAGELRRLVGAAGIGSAREAAARLPLRVACVEHFERLQVQVVHVLQGELRAGAVLTAAANPNGVGFAVRGELRRYPAGAEAVAAAGPGAVVSFATAAVFADQPGGALGEAHAVLGAVDFSGGAATFPLVEGLAVVDVALPAAGAPGPASGGRAAPAASGGGGEVRQGEGVLQRADTAPGREVAVLGLGGASTYVVVARRERAGVAAAGASTSALLLRPVENAARLVRPLASAAAGAGAAGAPWPVVVSVARPGGELAAGAGSVRWSRTRLQGLAECAEATLDSAGAGSSGRAGAVATAAFDCAMRMVRAVEAALPGGWGDDSGSPLPCVDQLGVIAPEPWVCADAPQGVCPVVGGMTEEERSIAVAAALEGLGEVLAPLTMWGAEARGPAASRVAAPEPASVAGRGFKAQPRAVSLLQLCAVRFHAAEDEESADSGARPLRGSTHRVLSVLRGLFDYLRAGTTMSKLLFPPVGHTPLPSVDLGREMLMASSAFLHQPGICDPHLSLARRCFERQVVSVVVAHFMLLAELSGRQRIRDSLLELATRDPDLFAGHPWLFASSWPGTERWRGIVLSLGTGLVSQRVLADLAPPRSELPRIVQRGHERAVFTSPMATFETVRIASLATMHQARPLLTASNLLQPFPAATRDSTSLATLNAVLVTTKCPPASTSDAACAQIRASPMRDWPLCVLFAAQSLCEAVRRIPLPSGCSDDVFRALDPDSLIPKPTCGKTTGSQNSTHARSSQKRSCEVC